jgi:peptidoglycan hydrolase CwlO-like protein
LVNAIKQYNELVTTMQAVKDLLLEAKDTIANEQKAKEAAKEAARAKAQAEREARALARGTTTHKSSGGITTQAQALKELASLGL